MKHICWFILLVGCGVRVVDYTNPRAKFKQYRTFTLLTVKGETLDELNELDYSSMIEASILEEMERRDYQVNEVTPDLIVRYELVAGTSLQRNSNNSIYSFQSFVPARSVTEGVILVEITDMKTRKLVWQASADLEDYVKKNAKKNPLERAITSIFDTYLYRAGQSQPDESLKDR